MAADHLRALVHQLWPDTSVRKLCRDAGLEATYIGNWISRDRAVDQMPKMHVMDAIARALKCDVTLVIEAFAADAGIPWGERITDDLEREVVYRLRLCSDDNRSAVRQLVRGLTGANQVQRHPS